MNELINILKECGLTESEAKVYLAILSKSGDAKDISKRSSIPYTKIHNILSNLEKKSLIISSNERPKIYYIKENGIEEYKFMIKEEIDKKFNKLKQLLKKNFEKSNIWIIKEKEEIINKISEILLSSKKEVKIAIPEVSKWFIDKIIPILITIKNQGVEINILTSDINISKIFMEFSKVKIRDTMFGGGIIVDNNEIILLIEGSDGNIAIWANHPGLVDIANSYFDFLWLTSK
ncbi:MAG: hypothetical protein NO475_03240 [Candidatus Methanomethylicia archaeon]|jgi:sugar-specific transcriptional regulator TrmB|nr:hypothetical protein [Candidatus Methanomethylicia archaeon]MCQ5341205.1 hypothetical protein [Candidatus Methanomethylicia archaeon]